MSKKYHQTDRIFFNPSSFVATVKEKDVMFFMDVANVVDYLKIVARNFFTKQFEFQDFLKQCYQVRNQFVGLIFVIGIIVGLVLTILCRAALVEFGVVAMLPGMVAISIIREMGPVITALICAGKIGSSMGAELGSMRVSEQID